MILWRTYTIVVSIFLLVLIIVPNAEAQNHNIFESLSNFFTNFINRLFSLIFVAVYSEDNISRTCPLDTKLCPDGVTTLGRVPPDCEFAECPESKDYVLINNQKVSLNCEKADDCRIVNINRKGFCCHDCENIDYSKENWVAVNTKSYGILSNAECPPDPVCAACIGKIINTNFTAKCVDNLCSKVLINQPKCEWLNADTCDRSCKSDTDCKQSLGYCVNVNENVYLPRGVSPVYEIHKCKCENNTCKLGESTGAVAL